MGFQVPTGTEITLEFEDGSLLEGLTVLCRSTSAERVREIGELPMDEAIALFLSEFVIEWDLVTAKGRKEIAVSADALDGEEPWIAQAIFGAWLRGLYAVPVPLGQPSNNGVT